MELRFIFGPASSGKSRACLSEIKGLLNSGKKLVYIVPEQFSLQSERDLADLCGKAVTAAQAQNFSRLSYRVFSETGYPSLNVLDECGKRMLLRRIAYELKGELNVFGKSADKQGFIDNMGLAVTEFYQYGVTAAKLYDMLPGLPEPLRLKTEDIARIFERYADIIEQNYLTTDAGLTFLAEKLPKSKYFDNSFVWFDGFFGFTPQEFACLQRILEQAERVTVALTLRGGAARFFNVAPSDPFYMPKTTVNKLTEFTGGPSDIAILGGVSGKRAEARALESRYFFVKKDEQYTHKCENIFIYAAPDPFAEISHAAARIIRLVRDCNYRYRDIAVILGASSGYAKMADAIFKQYEIPAFIDIKRGVTDHPLAETIRSAVEIITGNWHGDSVIRFLKAGLTDIDEDDIFELENYCIAYGIKSYKWKYSEWTAGGNDFDLKRVNAVKQRVMDVLSPFAGDLKPDGTVNVLDFSKRIYKLLETLRATEKLAALATAKHRAVSDKTKKQDPLNVGGELTGTNNELRKDVQIWNAVRGVFEKFAEIMPDMRMGVREYAKIMEAGLTGADIGLAPPALDQVTVADPERSRLPAMKALFVLNVNEGVLPAARRGAGILSDTDRGAYRERGLEIMDKYMLSSKQDISLYSLLLKPFEYLELSYSRSGVNGKTARPSNLITRLTRIFPALQIEEADEYEPAAPGPAFDRIGELPGEPELIRAGRSSGEPATGRAGELSGGTRGESYEYKRSLGVYEYFAGVAPYNAFIEKARRIIRRIGYEKLSPATVETIYGEELTISASRLEQYAACPFAYFVRYNAGARERRVYEIAPADMGGVLHGILEKFHALINTANKNLRDLDENDIRVYTETALNDILREPENEIYFDAASNAFFLGKLLSVSRKSIWALSEHMKLGEFEQTAAEMSFTAEGALDVAGAKGPKRFKLTGRADRVDVLEYNGNNYIKVIDYKSGNRTFDIADVRNGMQMQLALYLNYFIKNKNALPGGMFYFNLNDPIVSSEGLDPDADWRGQVEAKILAEYKMSGLALADAAVLRKMDSNIKHYSGVMQNIGVSAGSDTGFNKSADVLDAEGFKKLLDDTENKVKAMGADILSGRIEARPYKKGPETGCRYCPYGGVCGYEMFGE